MIERSSEGYTLPDAATLARQWAAETSIDLGDALDEVGSRLRYWQASGWLSRLSYPIRLTPRGKVRLGIVSQ